MDTALSLLETVTREAISFSNQLRDVQDKIRSLSSETSSFKAKLEKWTKHPITDPELKDFLKRYREALYEAEDIVDVYAVKNAKYQSKNKVTQFFSMNRHRKLVNLTDKIQKIIEDSRKIEENWKEVDQAVQGGDQPSYSDKKWKKDAKVENDVVGFEVEQKKIISLLIGGSDELEVTSIFGMSGLGKTTLARQILVSPEIEGKFTKRISVSITQNCSTQEVFRSILEHFSEDNEKIRVMSDDDVTKKLQTYLMRDNYLILMDDVHTEKDWDDLIAAFPRNTRKSRILLTTRFRDVANHASSDNKEVVTLDFLDSEKSWELLKRKALGSYKCPNKLEEHGRKIAKQCGGLPLTIVLMGGILSKKGRKSAEWEVISKDVGRHIDPNKPNKEKQGVKLSFYELPYNVKACFLYFGMFPKGSRILVKKLISVWIAEGFVQKEGDTCLEIIAEEYLDELVNKSLVLIENWSSNGKKKTCYVHDVVHEFCKSKAEEENLYQVIGKNYQRTHASDIDLHRVCIHPLKLEYITSSHLGTRVRSFFCSFPEKITWKHEDTIYPFKNHKLLRVFDGESITFTRFPSLDRLVHLRFLVLHTDDKILPECICDLWNLQTLIVIVQSPSQHTLEIKGDTRKMTQLRHVKTNASTSWKALSKGKNEKKVSSRYDNLSTLLMVSPETCTKDAFEKAPNLEKLGIRGQLAKLFEVINGGYSLFDNVIGLEALRSLKLVNHPMGPSDLKSKIRCLPEKFPQNLKKLTLVNTRVDSKYMSTLATFKLEILKLKKIAFEGSKWELNEEECFRDLEVLHIEETDLVVWKASAGNFPELKCLYLRRCTQLSEVPHDLGSSSTLETLELRWTSSLADDSANKIGEKILRDREKNGGEPFKLTIDSAI